MALSIQYDEITEIFRNAEKEGRNSLFEQEVYKLLSLSGAETTPKTSLTPTEEEILGLAGEKAVLKVVSPNISHKTEVGGVRIVPKTPEKVQEAIEEMYKEIPEKFSKIIEDDPRHAPKDYKNLHGEELKNAILKDIKGVLQVQFLPPDSPGFGNELIVALRKTSEFGTVLTAGLGGTDTELFGEHFKKGFAVASAPTEMTDVESFFELYKKTLSYKKLAGETRGQERIVSDEQLKECFLSMILMGNYFSTYNKKAEYIIEELEINPFAFTKFRMVPLDGMCKFSRQDAPLVERPLENIDNLLHPKTIGIIGVSSTRKNFGRIIVDNVLLSGYKKENIILIKEGEDPNGIKTVAHVKDLDKPLDLFVVAIDARHVPALVDDLIEYKAAKSVMLIPGGLGETEESKEIADLMKQNIDEAHKKPNSPLFLGANCMGVISRIGNYDTWFLPKEKLSNMDKLSKNKPRPIAIMSQSGAFLAFRMTNCPDLCPSYLVSIGNQTDLTLGDMMHYFENSDKVNVIAVYAEGFKDLDGLAFAQSVRRAVQKGKQVVFYKAGRTPEGKDATSGHTASLAGDYAVCETTLKQAGALVARNFDEFQSLIYLADCLKDKKINGKRIAAMSGAGFEMVGMADSIQSDEYSASFGTYSANTIQKMQEAIDSKNLSRLVHIANPMDINPAADDELHALLTEYALKDDNIDAVVLSIGGHAPTTHTLESVDPVFDMHSQDGILTQLKILKDKTDKPLVIILDGGVQFEPLRAAIRALNIPVFVFCDKAIGTLALYLETRLIEVK